MEEDIKILEDYIKLINKGYCEDCNELCNIHSTPVFPSRAIKQALENLLKAYKEKEIETKKDKETIAKLSFELGKYQAKSKEDEAVIEKLIDERNYIINNLKIDLNKKGVYSQAKGQISEILKYYKLNEKYIFNKSKEKKE